MNEDKAVRYHRHSRVAEVAAVACAAGAVAFIAWTGLAAVAVAGLFKFGEVLGLPAAAAKWAAVVFVALLLTFSADVAALPAVFYRGHVLERRYGLSMQPAYGWLRDHGKGLALRALFAVVAAAVLILTMERWPRGWWLAAAGAFTAVTVVVAHLTPVLLLPLFYRFKPLQRTELSDRLLELARKARTRVLGVYEWGLGEKTTRANAALVGVRGTRRILLSDTLLGLYSDDEIEVVLAHELAHHVHRDVWTVIAADTAITAVALLAADWTLRWAGPAYGVRTTADPAGLPVVVLAAGAVSLLSTPAMNLLSRRHERRADRFALELTGNADAFMSAMRRLAAQNLAEERPSALVQWLFYTHPPFNERIAAARNWQTLNPPNPQLSERPALHASPGSAGPP